MHRLVRCSAVLVAALAIYGVASGFGAVVRQSAELQRSYPIVRPAWAAATPVGF
jgi:hypothetical protein